MQWWKQYPPGWYAFDRWYEDGDEGGGGSGGDDDDDDDDPGSSGDDDDDDDPGDGDGGGGGGGSGEPDPGDPGNGGSGGFSGDPFEDDGDAGDDTAVAREWEASQRSFERQQERERQREEMDRERDRLAEEMERERQRQEEERRRQEEERRRAEAAAERQRALDEQERLAESYRLQQQQQNGIRFLSDQNGLPQPPKPEDAFYQTPSGQPVGADDSRFYQNPLGAPDIRGEDPGFSRESLSEQQPQSDYVIMHHRETGVESRLPRASLQFVTNADEFDIRDDVAASPLQLEQPREMAPLGAVPQADQARDDWARPPQQPVTPPGTTGQGGLFDSQPPEQTAPVTADQSALTVPEQAAQNAAAAVAATGAPPETVAATAELAARMATDRQTLADQSPWTRASFRSTYGDQAEQEWVRQHEAELGRNQRLYGSREPTAGSSPLYGAPAGTPNAPDRRVGVVPAPSPGDQAQYGLSTGRADAGAVTPPVPASARPANALGVGAIGDQAAPTTTTAPPAAPVAPSAPSTLSPGAAASAAPAAAAPAAAAAAPAAAAAAPAAAPPAAGGPRVAIRGPDGEIIDPYPEMFPSERAGEIRGPAIDTTQHGEIENPYNRRTVVLATGPDNVDHAFDQAEWEQQDPEVKNQYRDVYTVDLDPEGRPLAPVEQRGAAGQGGPTTLPTPEIVTTVPQAMASDRPIEALASMALVGQGQNVTTEAVQRNSYHIAQGISALLSGKVDDKGQPTGTWTEPYLNDVARLAWAKEEAGNGRTSDPRDAPVEYIEKWKDAFYGSDARVPMVKELDQQMLDYAASRTQPGQPFRWQDAYGPNGERMISRQVTEVDCGPNAFSTILRSRGYNVDPGVAFRFARQHEYHNGSEFTGPDNMVRMLRQEAGLNATSVSISPDGANWDKVDQELTEGRPVMISSPGHYWVITAKNPATGQYYVGQTALRNNPEWMVRGGFRYGGDANRAIFASGDVDPNSRSVREMNIKPPASTTRDTRGLLSTQTVTGQEPAPQQMSNRTEQRTGMPQAYVSEYERKAYNAAVKAGHPDPIEFVEQMRHESGNFAPDVITGKRNSSAGARGIAQLTLETYQSAKVDPLNVDQSLEYAANRMANNYRTYKGDSERALAEYNMGAGQLQKYGPRGLRETNTYLDIINGAKTKVRAGPLAQAEEPLSRAELLSMTRQPTGVGQRGASLAERAGGPYSYGESAPFQDTQLEPADPMAPPEPEAAAQRTPYPFADDPRVRAAASENVWSPRQPARQSLMVEYQQLPFEVREAAFDRAMDEGLAAEGITGDEATRWKRAMYEMATGTGRLQGVQGENPDLNPFMIAGESSGKPAYAGGVPGMAPSSATGYFQFIQSNRDGSDYGFMGYVPKEYNGDIYNPVAQVRQFVRTINASSNFRGNPDLAVANKRKNGHWNAIIQRVDPW
jgi:hypothetical protein